MKTDFTKHCKYELYIGLTDLEKGKSRFTHKQFTEYVKEYCTERKIDYSINRINGGFNHKTGYIVEASILITLLGDDSSRFLEAIEDIKELINTDTILVTREYVDLAFV